jgi:hypothetical protein
MALLSPRPPYQFVMPGKGHHNIDPTAQPSPQEGMQTASGCGGTLPFLAM